MLCITYERVRGTHLNRRKPPQQPHRTRVRGKRYLKRSTDTTQTNTAMTNQHSLTSAAQSSDAHDTDTGAITDSTPNSRSDTASAPTTETSTGTTDPDPQPELGEVHNLIEQRQRIAFRGLEPHSDAELPDHINRASPFYDENAVSFTDIIKLLPEAEEGALRAVNEYVNTDGTVDVDAINNVTGIDTDQLSLDPDDISHADRYTAVHDYKDIIDPRRKALAALGYNVKFRWQIATDSYAIINPKDAYFPAYKTFKEKGEHDTIFGWVDIADWGGRVNMYIFFTDHAIERPDGDDDDPPIYIGLHTGYDFSGGRAMDVKLFGYDPKNNVRFYSLGARRSRRHVGDPNNPEHERKQGRTPIKEWWDKEYENLLVWTDDLVDDIEFATATTIDFSAFNFGIKEFYSYLDIPDTYIEDTDNGIGAVKRAKRHSPSNSTFTMWTLFYSLSTTLEQEFQGEDYTGAAFKAYADIATNILRSPHTVIERVQREHEREVEKEQSAGQNKRAQVLDGDSNTGFDEITDLDGIATEDELNLVDKREIAQQRQENLFNYE